MIPRTLFAPEHEVFRESIRRFLHDEVLPHHRRWEAQQHVDREIWKRAGQLGFLCMTLPEEYGGHGVDRLFSVIAIEEQAYAGASGLGFALHSDIVAGYLERLGREDQKRRWLPSMARGEVIGAVAMTEPGAGSDLRAIKTHARIAGDYYHVNGVKTFITNGVLSDLIVVVVQTGDGVRDTRGLSLLLVEANSPGLTKGKPLQKLGLHALDTCELFFDDVRVPLGNRLGNEGGGFEALKHELSWERLIIAIASVASAESTLKHTLTYVRERRAFDSALADFQNTRFRLAEMSTELSMARVYLDRCIALMLDGKLNAADAAAVKFWCTELLGRVTDQCVQLHGGAGYILDTFVARAYADARAARIYGGSNEIMRELVARALWD